MGENILNLEEFERVLRMYEYNRNTDKILKLERFSIGNGQLSNMASDTYKQKVRIVTKDGKQYDKSFIVKNTPSHPMVRAFILKQGFFAKEVKMYGEVFPVMEELISSAGSCLEKIWPECMGYKPCQYLLLEDLSSYGYKLHPLNSPFDLEHSILACRALAKLHALSVIISEKLLINIPPLNDNYCGRMTKGRKLVLTATFQALNQVFSQWGPKWKELGTKLVNYSEEILNKFVEICQPNQFSLNVLNHGDPWMANFLFRYCKQTGQPSGIRLVDYQVSFYGSYGLDLQYFLHICVNAEILQKHCSQLLAAYHETFIDVFYRLNFEPQIPLPTFEEMKKEIESKHLYGVIVFLFISPRLYEKTRNLFTPELAFFQRDEKLIKDVMTCEEHLVKIKKIFEPYLERDLLS